jgi:DNA repair photolyase
VVAKSALNHVRGMPFHWSLNPYQGCVHGCHYCYARRYHTYLDLNPGVDFSSKIFVKTNLPFLLRQELRRPTWHREHVAVGTATDPYQPIEGRYRLTRRCLRAFVDYGTPAGVVTKGTLVVRDLDVLQDLNCAAGCAVRFSFCTLDEEVSHRVEPTASPPRQRLEAIDRLAQSGIPVGILLAPILPGISDGVEDLERIVRACVDHGAGFFDGATLRLAPEVKAHFMGFLAADYPQLMGQYERWYQGGYAPRGIRENIEGALDEIRQTYDLPGGPPEKLPRKRQLQLAL